MFNGPEYKKEKDFSRLITQHERVKGAMLNHNWLTISQISEMTGDPPASVSAQIRHLRKDRFGGWIIERRARGDRSHGLFEYRIAGRKDQGDARL